VYTLKNRTILITSNEPWGDVWYSKHNWAYELSRNNQVFFINPPPRWSLKNLFQFRVNVQSYSSSLKILTYNNRFPFTRFKIIYDINNFIVCRNLKKWFTNKNIINYIFWAFDPYRLTKPQLLAPIKSLYFRVDKIHKGFIQQEKDFIENVNHLIVTSPELLKDIKTANPLILTHGISLEEFTPTENVNYEDGYILYVGQIDYRLDIKLIDDMLTEFPNELFIFIGKLVDINHKLYQDIFYKGKHSNLILHGVEHFKSLKNYIFKSKICLAPMDTSVYGNDVHHHKSLQYLAMGKPIISPIFKDKINEGGVTVDYQDNNEAIQHIYRLMNPEPEDIINSRINFAKQFTYENLIIKIEIYFNQK